MKSVKGKVELTCVACGTSKHFSFSSPAAPMLTACETAAREGWSYQVGFFAMLTGDHSPRCATCTQAARVDQDKANEARS